MTLKVRIISETGAGPAVQPYNPDPSTLGLGYEEALREQQYALDQGDAERALLGHF